MLRKVGEELRKIFKPSALERFVIRGDACVLRDIAAEGLRDGSSRIGARLRKELPMMKLPVLALDIVQGFEPI